jgi:uroporphyrinogen-III decarboxylase
MSRTIYLDLAAAGLRMPIGTDLVLHEQPDAEAILLDGCRLGRIVECAARRYRTPLAFPLMDLRLEKADLAWRLQIPDAETWHFPAAPDDAQLRALDETAAAPFAPRNQAHIDAVRYIARETDLVPIGMAIGPFSLMTKLLEDPITPIAMAGMGIAAEDDPGVLAAAGCLEIAEAAVARSVAAQIAAGARAVLICEPAANVVYLSPRQIEAGSDIFERFVLAPNLRLRDRVAAANADLIFHDCGQLTPAMVREFAHRLHPAILSLGSSRVLWEDAALVPADVVLYGNLPTKSFYSDAAMPVEKVRTLAADLTARMRACGQPHILGSECDVLHVPEAAATIRRKVDAMLAPLT